MCSISRCIRSSVIGSRPKASQAFAQIDLIFIVARIIGLRRGRMGTSSRSNVLCCASKSKSNEEA
jgi:hypothetical protein